MLTYPFREYLPVSTLNSIETAHNIFEFVEFHLPCKFENNFSNNQIFDEKNLGAPGDGYLVIRDMRTFVKMF